MGEEGQSSGVVWCGPKRLVSLYLPTILIDRVKLKTDNLSRLVEELLTLWLQFQEKEGGKVGKLEQEMEKVRWRMEELEAEKRRLEEQLRTLQGDLLKAVEEEHRRLAEQIKIKQLQPWIAKWREMKEKPNLFEEEFRQRWLEDSARKLKMDKQELLKYLEA
jgi:predicted transcriptional regulator